MIRIELLHPIINHFTVAFLFIGVIVKLIGFFCRKKMIYPQMLAFSRALLTIGVGFALCSIITGELADDVVEKQLCELDVLQLHEKIAFATASAFVPALVLDWIRKWAPRRWLTVLSSILYISATGMLLLLGALGGDVVYSQGGAVKNECLLPH